MESRLVHGYSISKRKPMPYQSFAGIHTLNIWKDSGQGNAVRLVCQLKVRGVDGMGVISNDEVTD